MHQFTIAKIQGFESGIGNFGFNLLNFSKFRKSRKIFITIAKIQGFDTGKTVMAAISGIRSKCL